MKERKRGGKAPKGTKSQATLAPSIPSGTYLFFCANAVPVSPLSHPRPVPSRFLTRPHHPSKQLHHRTDPDRLRVNFELASCVALDDQNHPSNQPTALTLHQPSTLAPSHRGPGQKFRTAERTSLFQVAALTYCDHWSLESCSSFPPGATSSLLLSPPSRPPPSPISDLQLGLSSLVRFTSLPHHLLPPTRQLEEGKQEASSWRPRHLWLPCGPRQPHSDSEASSGLMPTPACP